MSDSENEKITIKDPQVRKRVLERLQKEVSEKNTRQEVMQKVRDAYRGKPQKDAMGSFENSPKGYKPELEGPSFEPKEIISLLDDEKKALADRPSRIKERDNLQINLDEDENEEENTPNGRQSEAVSDPDDPDESGQDERTGEGETPSSDQMRKLGRQEAKQKEKDVKKASLQNDRLEKDLFRQERERLVEMMETIRDSQERAEINRVADKFNSDLQIADEAIRQIKINRSALFRQGKHAEAEALFDKEMEAQQLRAAILDYKKNFETQLSSALAQREEQKKQRTQQVQTQSNNEDVDPADVKLAEKLYNKWSKNRPQFKVEWRQDIQNWTAKNDDTETAMAVMAKMEKDGFNPTTPEYYEELDNRLAKYVPEWYDEDTDEPEMKRKPNKPVVAGGSEGGSGNNPIIPKTININDLPRDVRKIAQNLRRDKGDKAAADFLKKNYFPHVKRG